MPDTGLNDSGVGHGQLNQSLVQATSRRVVHEKPPRDLFLSKTGFASIVNPASLVLQGGLKIANRIRMITLCDRPVGGSRMPRQQRAGTPTDPRRRIPYDGLAASRSGQATVVRIGRLPLLLVPPECRS